MKFNMKKISKNVRRERSPGFPTQHTCRFALAGLKTRAPLTLGFLLLVILGVQSCNHPSPANETNIGPKKFSPEYDRVLFERLHPYFSTNHINQIKIGMSEEHVNELMDSRGRHQFTLVISNQFVRCVEHVPQHYRCGWYFVFTNGVLSSVCSKPKEEYVDMHDEKGAYFYTSYDRSNPLARVQDVLNAPSLLLRKDFAAMLLPANPPEKSTQSIDYGLTTAYLLVSPLRIIGKINAKKDDADYLHLADFYMTKPFLLYPNMNRGEVETILGEPNVVHTNGVHDVYFYYGEKIKHYGQYMDYFWITVLYGENGVAGVFTLDFMDREAVR